MKNTKAFFGLVKKLVPFSLFRSIWEKRYLLSLEPTYEPSKSGINDGVNVLYVKEDYRYEGKDLHALLDDRNNLIDFLKKIDSKRAVVYIVANLENPQFRALEHLCKNKIKQTKASIVILTRDTENEEVTRLAFLIKATIKPLKDFFTFIEKEKIENLKNLNLQFKSSLT